MGLVKVTVHRFCIEERRFHDDVQDLPLIIMKDGSQRVRRVAKVFVEQPDHLRKVGAVEGIGNLLLQRIVGFFALIRSNPGVHRVIAHIH